MKIRTLYIFFGLTLLGNFLWGQTITVQPENDTACVGNLINYSVIVSGGTAPISYEWQRDTVTGSWHVLPGQTTNNISITAGANGNKNNSRYRVVVTDGVGTRVISDSAFLIIYSLVPNLINVEASGVANNDWMICAGDQIAIIASGGGTGANYEFFLDGTSVQNGTSTTYIPNPILTANANVQVTITDGICSGSSNLTPITVSAYPNAGLTFTENSGAAPNDGTICAGDPVNFRGSGGRGAGIYEFFVNGVSSQSSFFSAFIPNPAIATNTTVTVTLTENGCATTHPGINIIALQPYLPILTVTENSGAASNDGIICSGGQVIFSTPAGVPGTTYDFYLNGTSVQNGTSNTYSPTPGLTANANVLVTVTEAGCSNTSVTVPITVNPYPNPGLTFNENSGTTTNDGIICAGDPITFTATGASGGANFEFFVNAVSVQNGSSNTYTPNPALAANANVSVTIEENGCPASSGNLPIIVNSNAGPTLTFAENSGVASNDGIICPGGTITFTASGGGAGAIYEFFANGTSVQSGTSNTYTPNPGFNTNTTVTASLFQGGCGGTSSGTLITVASPPAPGLTFTESSGTANNDGIICTGDPVTFTASGPGGNTTYEFFVNGVSMQNTTSKTFSPSPALAANSIIFVILDANGCTSVSSGIQINVLTPVVPGLTFVEHSGAASNDGIICSGYVMTFTASGGQGQGVYEFFVNGVSAQLGGLSGFTPNPALTSNSTVTVVLTENGCSASSPVVNISTIQPTVPSLTFSENSGVASNDGTICAGDPITLFASGGTAGAIYDFYANGSLVQSGLGTTYIPSPAITSNTNFTVTLNQNNCNASSGGLNIIVNPYPTPVLSFTENSGVASNDGIICAGHPVTFTATGGMAGSNYAFFVNGISAQSGTSSIFIPSPALSINSTVTVTISQNGCISNSSAVFITTNSSPISNLTFTESSGVANNDGVICFGDPIMFTASGGGSGATYEFFVNGTPVQNGSSSTFTPSPAFTSNTTVSVTTTENGCDASSGAVSITVNPIPSATLSFSEASGNVANDATICSGDSITFTAIGGGTGATYNFLVNGVSAQNGPSNIFIPSPGLTSSSTVGLTLTENGCEGSANPILIVVDPNPSAGLGVTDNSGVAANDGIICEGDPLTFTGSGGSSYGFFLNGVAQGLPSGNTTYTQSNFSNGDEVFVRVINTNGCFDDSPPFMVTVNAVTASLVQNGPDTICSGDPVTFIASGGTHYTFYNDADSNGVYVTSEIVQSRSPIPTYLPASVNNRDRIVVLVENNMVGCEAYAAPILMHVNSLPNPQFSVGPDQICQGTPNVQFCLSQTYVSHTWKLDGNAVPGTNNCKSFVFNNGGSTSDVSTEVTDGNGCTNSVTKTITVNALPNVQITDPGTICINQNSITLRTSLPGGIFSGPGITDTTVGNFDPQIAGVGIHVVSYTFTDLNGCTNDDIQSLEVLMAPNANFTFDNTIPCRGVPTQFTSTSTGAATQFWTFPDGFSSSEVNPRVVLPIGLPDTNYVQLLIITGECRDSITKAIPIKPQPKAEFGFDLACFNSETNFINNSRRDSDVFNSDRAGMVFRWSFDGEGTSTQESPSHEFMARKTPRTVRLIAINDQGCADTLIRNDIGLNLCGPFPYLKRVAKDGDPGLLLIALDSSLLEPDDLTYQWYRGNGTPISESEKGTRQFYFITDFTQADSYYVETVRKDGLCPCTSRSSRLASPIALPTYEQGMTISPNPNSGGFLLDVVSPSQGSGILEIIDQIGRVIYRSEPDKTDERLHLSLNLELSPGMYLVRYRIEGQLKLTEKMIIRK